MKILDTPTIETERLILRKWEKRDLEGLIELCSDTKVMEFFPSTLSEQEAAAFLERCLVRQEEFGSCFPVVEDKTSGEFLGFTGLTIPAYQDKLEFGPCVEIGWRLLPGCWGRGVALEAATAWLDYGFKQCGLHEIIAFTTKENVKSRRVMEKLRMTYNSADDFNHPSLSPDHPLAMHVLYRMRASDWSAMKA
ncbi:GNAT family N-acetyltransferase [Flexibacterium corallicola]|uniref:GNAT family N-acetyltransferase n=1 Tax=Flexibacterium corallicola TaxID=3037259 RepID=UPI00286F5E55|nr:GNAT family N-acetyltransferase [Pseudovibrio sp. M1P-2-3]